MTRINCIPPTELNRQMLLAEYRELPRVRHAWPPEARQDWEPDAAAMAVNRARIAERLGEEA